MVNFKDFFLQKILKRPELDNGDAAFEEQKKHISLFFRKCKARYRSMVMLSEPEDVLIIAEKLILDLANLTLLIYGNQTAKEFLEARSKLEKLPNQAIAHLFIMVTKLHHEACAETKKYRKTHLVHKQRKDLCNLLFEIKKVRTAEQKDLRTARDAYNKRKLRFFLCTLVFVAVASWGIVVGVNRVRNFNMIEEAENNVNYLANVTFKAKMNTKKLLFEITGSVCSVCPCRNGKQLKGLPGTDPCVESWNSAIRKIWQTAEGKPNVPNEYLRDPWGSPYTLDENEREFGPKDCRKDDIRSAGEDGILETKDDIAISIPNVFCQDR